MEQTSEKVVFSNLWTKLAASVKTSIFPAKCLVCNSFIYHCNNSGNNPISCLLKKNLPNRFNINDLTFEKLIAPYLCIQCSDNFLTVTSPICHVCGIMFKSLEGKDRVCGECLSNPKKFRMARALGVFDQPLVKLIQCFKYQGKIQLAQTFEILLLTVFLKYWEKDSIDIVIPVPLHKKRFRKRGYNQAYLLVRNWLQILKSANIKWPYLKIDRHAIIRKKFTKPQVGLDRKKRMANVKNAFEINIFSDVTEKKMLLVDDVYTTGATVNECANVLLNAGARYVDVLTLARSI